MPDENSPREYQPGQIVPTSGIYTAVHEVHRSPHEVVAIKGEEFPSCRACRDGVRFHITQLVPHMTHDFDLTGPTAPREKRAKAAGKGNDA